MSKARILPGDGDPRHGTTNGYSNLYCRCQLCRDAWTAYCLKLRARRAQNPPPAGIPHGRESTYSNWGCRCDPCKQAHAAYRRQYLDARRRAHA